MIKFISNHPIKIILLIAFITIEYLNFTGFCYSEIRYLAKEELLKRGMGEIYEENPNCCAIFESPHFNSGMDNFLNSFFGRHLFGMIANYAREKPLSSDHDYPYYSNHYYMTSCGKSHFDFGETIKEDQYLAEINSIKNSKKE